VSGCVTLIGVDGFITAGDSSPAVVSNNGTGNDAEFDQPAGVTANVFSDSLHHARQRYKPTAWTPM